MSEYTPAEKAREALNTLIQEAGQWRKIAEFNAQEAKDLRQQLHATRQRELPKGETDGHYIDGHPIEYWHSIATATLKTNNELIDRVKELKSTNEALVKCHQDQADSYTKRTDELIETRRRERVLLDQLREKEHINADLEWRATASNNTNKSLLGRLETIRKTLDHQQRCAESAQNERDTALRELDAMRERLQKADETAGRYCNEALELRKKLQFAERQMDIAHTALLKR